MEKIILTPDEALIHDPEDNTPLVYWKAVRTEIVIVHESVVTGITIFGLPNGDVPPVIDITDIPQCTKSKGERYIRDKRHHHLVASYNRKAGIIIKRRRRHFLIALPRNIQYEMIEYSY